VTGSTATLGAAAYASARTPAAATGTATQRAYPLRGTSAAWD
jgi:hypothetical protein